LGAALLQRCVAQACLSPSCGAVYLHVITYNAAAMRFYERAGFTRWREMRGYYSINGERHNCYVYALFINGAAPSARMAAEAGGADAGGAAPAAHGQAHGLVAVVSERLRQIVRQIRRWLGFGDEGRRKGSEDTHSVHYHSLAAEETLA
jgi:hypothetical protein